MIRLHRRGSVRCWSEPSRRRELGRRGGRRGVAGPASSTSSGSAAALTVSKSSLAPATTASTSVKVAWSAKSPYTRTVTSANGSPINLTQPRTRRRGRRAGTPARLRAPAVAAPRGRPHRERLPLRHGQLGRSSRGRRRSAAVRAGVAVRGGPLRGSARWDRCGLDRRGCSHCCSSLFSARSWVFSSCRSMTMEMPARLRPASSRTCVLEVLVTAVLCPGSAAEWWRVR